ncbi:hypothetical protein K435DRAFT_870969 [Dendrothele bispora CBS 962.96]|uniref:Uncharacterized protein n=1 Tax=Dendrothele bispora (strain CBS 962.96) TaxID=1314807 RepID=A0A4S8L5C8_DENBC|nr:hypothetical protein K435DRAFT_870969 [Dendrothele bispora CBS 962.96]
MLHSTPVEEVDYQVIILEVEEEEEEEDHPTIQILTNSLIGPCGVIPPWWRNYSTKPKTESSSSWRFQRKAFALDRKVTAEVEDSEEDSVTLSASEDLAKEAQAMDNKKRAKSAPSQPPWPKQPVFDQDDLVNS